MKLKFRKNKSCHEKWTAHWVIVVTSVLLEPIKQRLIDVTSFKLSKSLNSRFVMFKSTNNFGFVFPNHLNRRIYETKIPTAGIFSMEGECFIEKQTESLHEIFAAPSLKRPCHCT
jgi:hypothetical protein